MDGCLVSDRGSPANATLLLQSVSRADSSRWLKTTWISNRPQPKSLEKRDPGEAASSRRAVGNQLQASESSAPIAATGVGDKAILAMLGVAEQADFVLATLAMPP